MAGKKHPKQEENGFLGPAAVNGLNAFGVGLIKAVFFWYLAPTMSYSFKHSLNRCPRMVVWSEIVSDGDRRIREGIIGEIQVQ